MEVGARAGRSCEVHGKTGASETSRFPSQPTRQERQQPGDQIRARHTTRPPTHPLTPAQSIARIAPFARACTHKRMLMCNPRMRTPIRAHTCPRTSAACNFRRSCTAGFAPQASWGIDGSRTLGVPVRGGARRVGRVQKPNSSSEGGMSRLPGAGRASGGAGLGLRRFREKCTGAQRTSQGRGAHCAQAAPAQRAAPPRHSV